MKHVFLAVIGLCGSFATLAVAIGAAPTVSDGLDRMIRDPNAPSKVFWSNLKTALEQGADEKLRALLASPLSTAAVDKTPLAEVQKALGQAFTQHEQLPALAFVLTGQSDAGALTTFLEKRDHGASHPSVTVSLDDPGRYSAEVVHLTAVQILRDTDTATFRAFAPDRKSRIVKSMLRPSGSDYTLYFLPGVYEWQRPKGVNFVVVRGFGGGGGGAGGGDRRKELGCPASGGGGAGAEVLTRLVGPLTEATYKVTVGRGGAGGPAGAPGNANRDVQPTVGEDGGDSSFANFSFPGGPGGNHASGGRGFGAAGGDSIENNQVPGQPGKDSPYWSTKGGAGGATIPHNGHPSGGGGGGGGASFGPGGDGGASRGEHYDGDTGSPGGLGAGGGGGGGQCWGDAFGPGRGGDGGNGQLLIVWGAPNEAIEALKKNQDELKKMIEEDVLKKLLEEAAREGKKEKGAQ